MMNKVVGMGKKLAGKAVTAKRWLMCAGMCAIVEMNSAVCYAAGEEGKKAAEEITNKFKNLENFVIAVIGAGGVVYLAKSVYEFASAYQASDSSGVNSAIKGIIGGLMMISLGVIIGFLR